MRHLWRTLVVLAATSGLVACCGDKSDSGDATDSGTGDTTGDETTEAAVDVTAGPDWGLPEVDVPGAEGATVMAVSPIGDSWDVVGWKVGELKEVTGTKATFVASSITERPNTPGALMVKVPDDPRLKVGDIVMGDVYATCRLARVEAIEGDAITARTVWIGEATDVQMTLGENVAKAPAGLKPLGIAAYPRGEDRYLGEVAHVSSDTVWLISPAGAVEQAPLKEVVPINPFMKHKVGHEVFAVWGGGQFYPATIAKVLDGGLMYEVDYDSDNPALAENEVKAFWEVAKSVQPGQKFSAKAGDGEDSTPAPTYSDGEPVERKGRSEGGRTSVPVARPKR